MNKIRKILSVIPILSCICVLSLTTHAAENQNKNYLSDLRVYAGVESKENIIKDFKPDKLEYSIVVPNEKVRISVVTAIKNCSAIFLECCRKTRSPFL